MGYNETDRRSPEIVCFPVESHYFVRQYLQDHDYGVATLVRFRDSQSLMTVVSPEELRGSLAKYITVYSKFSDIAVSNTGCANELDVLPRLPQQEEIYAWAADEFPGFQAAGLPVVLRYLYERELWVSNDDRKQVNIPFNLKPVGPMPGRHLILPPNRSRSESDPVIYGFIQAHKGERIGTRTNGQVPKDELFRQLTQFGITAAFLEKHGIMQGDWKPKQLIVDSRGQGTLVDFELARILNAAGAYDHRRLTIKDGRVFRGCTPQFGSPEQLNEYVRFDLDDLPEEARMRLLGEVVADQRLLGSNITVEDILRIQPVATIGSDVYSFALTVASVLNGGEYVHTKRATGCGYLEEMLQACWQVDPCRRPTFLQVARNMAEIASRELIR